ncbi:MAG: hypothetical protein WBL45_12975 [Solirubrobacterales bacterium]
MRRSIAVAMMALGMLMAASVAQADTNNIIEKQGDVQTKDDGWQSGTCINDAPLQCAPETPQLFFNQAGGHPPVGFTQYIVQHNTVEPVPGVVLKPLKDPLEDRDIRTLRVDLPPGLTVNPEATGAKCTVENFLRTIPGVGIVPNCDPATMQTGEEKASLVVNETGFELEPGKPLPKGAQIPLIPNVSQVKVFNLVPEDGEPALFGFVIGLAEPVFLTTEVAWESDFHESFTIHLEESDVPGLSTLTSRLVNFGESGNGTFITNPTTCFNPAAPATEHLYSTWFRAESFGEPDEDFPNGSTPVEAKLPEGEKPEECETIPFEPSIDVEPGTNQVDSPASPTVTTEMPFDVPTVPGEAGHQGQSHLRSATVQMPAGMGLNPSGSVGLAACTDAQFNKGVRINDNTCPANSVIGSAEVVTPVLSETLKGQVYVGEQKSSDPTSGEEFRILAEAKSLKLGIVARLVGNISANPTTGQLTAVFDEQQVGPLAGPLPKGLPQVPFESVVLKFDGAHKVLSSPPICAKADTTTTMVPWSGNANATPGDSFTLTSMPGGGACPTTLAQRPFAPAYTAKTDNTQGGASSPFRVHIGRSDGQQEVKLVDVTLPKGLTGKLAGIPYCSEGAIGAAAANSGVAEQKAPSCGAASMIGTTSTESGTGANPLKLPGNVYLAGPYNGAPLSLAVITPAVSGPFDLGVVVVRVALKVNPETAQITAVSDVIPDVFDGVKLDLRTIDFNIDRSGFMVNPTNCAAQAVTGAINGGGADPTNPAAFSAYAVNTPFQATGCKSLKFKPKLVTKLTGGTTRNKYPRLTATLTGRNGDANIARTALTMPSAFFVAQNHIKTVCTRPQLAAKQCPKSSVYGQAEATSPLLDGKLSGPVYLVPGGHTLPDLVADLRGQVNIQLRGVISSKRGGIKTVFNNTPDVAVKKFVLKMQGGKKGLIVNSTNICKGKHPAILNIKGQNGKQVKNNKYGLNLASCGKKKKGKK